MYLFFVTKSKESNKSYQVSDGSRSTHQVPSVVITDEANQQAEETEDDRYLKYRGK